MARRDRGRPSAFAHVPTAALLPAVGYLRRSTDRQEQSVDDQRTAVERYAREHGMRLLRHYVDDGVSGTSSTGRRAFQRLIDDAHGPARDFAYVVCYDVKRFGRVDNDEAGYYRHLLRTRGVEVRYASEGFTGDGVDDLLRPVKQWQARQESKDLAKVAIRGLVSKVKAEGGWWMGGAPPYGFDLRYESSSGEFIFIVRYERDGSKRLLDERGGLVRTLPKGETIAVSKRDRCRLVHGEPERVATVRLIFSLYVDERAGYKTIADRLNRDGVSTARCAAWAPHYSGHWSTTSVRAILMNPVYTGDLTWNRRTDARFFRIRGDGDAVERNGAPGTPGAPGNPGGRRLEPNDVSDWIVVRDAHEPLIDRSLWLRAEAIRLNKAVEDVDEPGETHHDALESMSGRSGPKARFLLSGLVRCARCGSTYEGRTDRPSKPNAGGERPRTYGYACGGYIRHGRSVCTRGHVRQETLERIVLDALARAYRAYSGPKGDATLRRAVEKVLKVESERVDAQRREVEARVEKIDAVIRNLLDNITPANRALVDKRLTELGFERRDEERVLDRLDARAVSRVVVDAAVREAKLCLAALGSLGATGSPLNAADDESRQGALRCCVVEVVIERDASKAAVVVRRVPRCSSLPDDLPTSRIATPINVRD